MPLSNSTGKQTGQFKQCLLLYKSARLHANKLQEYVKLRKQQGQEENKQNACKQNKGRFKGKEQEKSK